MDEQKRDCLRAFASLRWYEEVIRFLFTFTAKTSEVLLAAGLVVSTANFLTDGKVMGSNIMLATAWAWAQALAIDSSLGVTFYYVFMSAKHHDWIKVLCYGLLTLLLAVVAGTITNVDTFSHALHISITDAANQVGLDIKVLTTLRAIAVIGFILMSRLKDVSFKDLYGSDPRQAPPHALEPNTEHLVIDEKTVTLLKNLINEALVSVVPRGTQQSKMAVIEEKHELLSPALQANVRTHELDQNGATSRGREEELETEEEQELIDELNTSPEEREVRLERAYHELKIEGKRISGRSLAARAHIRRSTCNEWLELHYPDADDKKITSPRGV